ncbi:MAG: hypothetical protein H0V89_05430 [Deltaproteobacteria bacterium]|nr:hypothetical protein [Deltaproteobacteria bacterium]
MLLFLIGCAPDPGIEAPPAPVEQEELPYNGSLERQGDRDVLYLWGTRAEIGYAEGALTCDRVGPLFKAYLLEHLVGEYTDFTYELARAFVLGSTTFDARDLEELDGYWQGANEYCTDEQLTIESELIADSPHRLVWEDLLFANAVADFGCSSFTVWGDASATGEMVHGRNFDWAIDPAGTFVADHMLKVYDSTDEGARFVSVMVPAMQGCVTCVTDESLVLTMHNVSGLTPDETIGISPRMLSARAALAATSGADDPVGAAETVLEGRRQLVGNNLHLAMPVARGDGIGGVVLEVDGAGSSPDGQVTVRRAGEDAQETRTDVTLAANHYAKRRSDLGDDDSNGRIATLAAFIDEAPVAAGDGRGMLDSVKNGYDGVTAHSIVFDAATSELQLYVAPGFDVPAPEAEPVIFDLNDVFGRLAELSGD